MSSSLPSSLSRTHIFVFLMTRRPPRSTLSSSSAASDVYKRQEMDVDISQVSQSQVNISQRHEKPSRLRQSVSWKVSQCHGNVTQCHGKVSQCHWHVLHWQTTTMHQLT
eukprot:TRINITY_DN30469_c0_g1_i1.p1 TRINITY_DN30469_c0_g1~~TRINITY_DN30469_c0_g1_i1.p1  ORF type:complete len:109 (+),score=15.93 TRINITY_DN30469_c0_g1_i1:2-328(+)